MLHNSLTKKKKDLSVCMPQDFGAVDVELERGVKIIKANLLCFATIVPENY